MNRQWPPDFLIEAKSQGDGKVLGLEYPPLSPSACPNCGGYGAMFAFFVSAGPSNYHPGGGKIGKWLPDFGGWFEGQTRSADCPVCAGHNRSAYLEKMCGLSDAARRLRLADFRPLPGKDAARQAAADLLAQTPTPAGFLTYWSDGYGRGKTLLLSALVNGFRIAGILSVYTLMSDLLAAVRDGYADNAPRAAEVLIKDYSNVRVLCIDEIDRVNLTPWAEETFFRLLDHRYTARSNLLTVIATNTNPANLTGKLGYLGSRMSGGRVVQVGGEDMRPISGDDEP